MSRSAREKQDALAKRKTETGSRRGDATQGFGKDPPPKGGRNRAGRGG